MLFLKHRFDRVVTFTHSFIFEELHGPFLAFKITSGPPAYCYLMCTSVSTAIPISWYTPQLSVPLSASGSFMSSCTVEFYFFFSA